MKIRIFIRAETLLILLHKRGWSQKQLAQALNLSEAHIHDLIQRKYSVKAEHSTRLMDTFRGMSHKAGGRLSWHDLFESELVGTEGTA